MNEVDQTRYYGSHDGLGKQRQLKKEVQMAKWEIMYEFKLAKLEIEDHVKNATSRTAQ
jgi:hypothetical protein